MFNGQNVSTGNNGNRNDNRIVSNNSQSSFQLDALEERRLLAWGDFPQAMDQDLAVSKYPNIDGRGLTIANIDSGVSSRHSKLQGKLFTNPGEVAGNGRDDDGNGYTDDVNGWNFVHNNNNPADDQGHGTMTAGFMVASRWTNTGNSRGYSGDGREYQGIAPGADVLSLKVVTSSMGFNISNVEKALQYVIKNRSRFNIAAVNMSLDVGSGGYSVIKDELATLWNSGVWIAASSGNGYNANNNLAWPAMGPYAGAIGAMDADGSVASVGSRGSSLTVIAPGSKVPYIDRGNSYWLGGNGTSYSAPFGTAAGLLVKQVNPRFSADQVESILKDSGAAVQDSGQTFKRLDLDNAIALAYARSGQASNPAPAPAPSSNNTSPTPSTSSGGRSAFNVIQAESFSSERGVLKGAGGIIGVDAGDWVKYDDVNFGSGANSLWMRIAVPRSNAGKTVELRLDSATGPIIGRINPVATDGWYDYDPMSTGINRTSGIHDLYLTFSGGTGVANIDSFQFSTNTISSGSNPAPRSAPVSSSSGRSAYNVIQAESLTEERGATKISGGVGSVDSGDWIKYADLDFGSTGATSFSIRLAVPRSLAGKKVQVRLGSPTGQILGTITTRATDGWHDYDSMSTSISRTTGVRDIYLTFSGGGTIGNIDSFQFYR